MPTTATLQYTVARSGNLTAAQLAALMAAVPLPTVDLRLFGISLTSDITTSFPNEADRTLIFNFVPIFQPFRIGPPSTFHSVWEGGSIVSSSEEDQPQRPGGRGVGLGAHVIRIRERVLLVTGKEIEYVTLSGRTPKTLIGRYTPQSLSIPLAIQIPLAIEPTVGLSLGYLQQFTMPDMQGDMVTYLAPQGGPLGFQGSIFSTSPDDTALGVGARTVTISYIDSSLAPQVEVIALNGTTPVNTVSTTIHDVTGMVITTAGSVTANLGTISLRNAPLGEGGVAGRILPSYESSVAESSPQSQSVFPGMFRHILAAALQSPVTELITVV